MDMTMYIKRVRKHVEWPIGAKRIPVMDLSDNRIQAMLKSKTLNEKPATDYYKGRKKSEWRKILTQELSVRAMEAVANR